MTEGKAENTQTPAAQAPAEALKRLEKLVGSWSLTGRTPDAQEDNLSGHVTIEWLPGGFFLEQRGEINFKGTTVQSLEIVFYDPETKTFPSHVYSNMDKAPGLYYWDVQGNVVTHWTTGSKYTGTFSEDGNKLIGGWRPTDGQEGVTYDATMTRVKNDERKTL